MIVLISLNFGFATSFRVVPGTTTRADEFRVLLSLLLWIILLPCMYVKSISSEILDERTKSINVRENSRER